MTANWLSATSGNWTSTTAWSTAGVFPANNATTTFATNLAVTGAPYTVTLGSGQYTIDSLTLSSTNATLAETGGYLTVSTLSVNSGTYTLDGATLTSARTNVSGTFNWQSGTFAGTGSIVVAAGGVLNVGSTNVARVFTPQLTNNGTLNVGGTFSWGSQNAGTIINNGYLNYQSAGYITSTANLITVDNHGTITVNTQNRIRDIANYGVINYGAATLNLARLICKTGGSLVGTGVFAPTYINGDTDFTINAPTLTIQNGGMTSDGVLTLKNYAKLENSQLYQYETSLTGKLLTTATNTLDLRNVEVAANTDFSGTTNLLGTGTLLIKNYTTSFNGVGGRLVNNGTFNLPTNSTISFNNGTLINNARMNYTNAASSAATFSVFGTAAGTNVFQNAGTISINVAPGTLSLNAPLTNSGTIEINSGTLLYPSLSTIQHATGSRYTGGALVSNGTMGFLGSGTFQNAQTIINNGTINGTGTAFFASRVDLNAATLMSAGTVTNLSTGTLNVLGPVTLKKVLVNQGALNLDADIDASAGTFVNSGTINAHSGGRILTGLRQFRNTGSVLLQAGSTALGANVLNEGTVQAQVNVAVPVANITNNGVVDTGSYTLSVADLNQTAQGRYIGSGTLLVSPTSSIGFDSAGTASFENGTTIFNYGTISGTGMIRNFGYMKLQNVNRLLPGGTFVNEAGGVFDPTSAALGRPLTNNGTLALSQFFYNAIQNGSGPVPLGTITNNGYIALTGGGIGPAPVVNNGTVVVNGPGGTLGGIDFGHHGVLTLNSGSTSVAGTLNIWPNSTIAGAGTLWLYTGSMNAVSDATFNNAVTVLQDGTLLGSGRFVFPNITNVNASNFITKLSWQATGENLGTMTFTSGSFVPINTGTLINRNQVIVQGNAITTVAKALLNTGTITVFAGGTLELGTTLTGQGTLNANGTVNFTGSGVSVVGPISIAGGTGRVDLRSADLIHVPKTDLITAFDTIRDWISSGRLRTTAVGRVLGSATPAAINLPFGSTWKGTSLPIDAIIITPTLAGDANLDYKVDSSDFNSFLSHYGERGWEVWWAGDFNYDDTVNTLDFNLLAGSFGSSIPPGAVGLGSMVPEPALGLCAITMLAYMRRRNGK